MAITFDAATKINNVGSPATSVSGSHTIGSGNNRIVWVFMSYNAGASTGVTYNGVSMTYSGISCTTGGSVTLAYYLINPPTGTNTVVANTTLSATILLAVHSYFGVHQSTPIDVSSTLNNFTSGGTGSSVSTAITTTKDVDWVIGVTRANVPFTLAGSGFTERINQSSLYESADTNGQIDSRGTTVTYTVTVNGTSGTFCQMVIAMRAYTLDLNIGINTFTITDTLRRSTSRSLIEIITLVDTVRRSTTRRFAEIFTIVDTINNTRVTVKSLLESITIVDTIRRLTSKSLREVVTVVDTIRRSSTRRFTETITVVDRIAKNAGKRFIEVISIADLFVVTQKKNFFETITILDKPIRFIMRAKGYILGRNNNTGIKTGTRTNNIGNNNNTGTKTGTRLK